jgi:hypothetical protein
VTIQLLLIFCVLAAVLMDSVMIEAGVAPPLCSRCHRPRAERTAGKGTCRC